MQRRLHVHGWETGVNSTLHYFTHYGSSRDCYHVLYQIRGTWARGDWGDCAVCGFARARAVR